MERFLTLLNNLESLVAELIAADPSDAHTATRIANQLSALAEDFDADSDGSTLIRQCAAILHALACRQLPHSPEAMTLLAESIVAVRTWLKAPEDTSLDSHCRQTHDFLAGAATDVPAANIAVETVATPAEPSYVGIADEGDIELLNDFIVESTDHLAEAESALLELETHPEDLEQVNTVLRAFHTIKGASAFMGLDNVQDLAHRAESFLSQARDGEILISGLNADLALQSCDALRRMIESLGTSQHNPDQLAADVGALTLKLASPIIVDTGQGNDTDRPAAVFSDAGETKTAGSNSTVRVSTSRLDDLIDMVGELVIAQSVVSQETSASGSVQAQARNIAHADKIVRNLQELAMSLRMVPLKPLIGRMTRVARDLARKSGKQIRLLASGEETEIDRNMVEELTDPIIHMIRNAVDHGIESPGQRAASGKNDIGTIHLRAYHSAGNVVIELADDGKGLDRNAILTRAVERGMVNAGAELTDKQIFSLIFEPGFSTQAEVTEISGRGVGMDVVKRNITSLHGRIDVQSIPGQGTTFRLLMPLTMAITDAMLLRVGTERYLLPTIAIERSFRPAGDDIIGLAGGGELVMCRGDALPLIRLHRIFAIDSAVTEPTRSIMVVIYGNGQRCALMVDELIGHQQAVIKSLGPSLQNIPGTAGGAILGDGQVGIILDADSLIHDAQNLQTKHVA